MNIISLREILRTVGLLITLLGTVGYVFLNARNDWYADIALLLFLLPCLLRLILVDLENRKTCKGTNYFLAGYLGLALVSVMFPPSVYVSAGWLIKSFFRLICVALMVQAVLPITRYDRVVLRYTLPSLCLILAFAIISNELGLLSKNVLSIFSPWHIVEGAGHNKYVSFCMLFLMWGAVASLWRRGFRQTLGAIFIIVISVNALLLSTSESSQLAAFVSLLVFLLGHINVRKWHYRVYLLCFVLFLIIPILWVTFTPVMTWKAWDVFQDSSSFLGKHWAIGSRLYLYDFCADIVRKEFLFGYGFGSTLSIPIPSGILPGWSILPGGHPHNIVFLFLIEHGFAGFLWLSGMTVMLFNYLYKATLISQGPAIWALAISGQIVFSLSFSIWHPDVVLTYGIFFILLLIIANFSED